MSELNETAGELIRIEEKLKGYDKQRNRYHKIVAVINDLMRRGATEEIQT